MLALEKEISCPFKNNPFTSIRKQTVYNVTFSRPMVSDGFIFYILVVAGGGWFARAERVCG